MNLMAATIKIAVSEALLQAQATNAPSSTGRQATSYQKAYVPPCHQMLKIMWRCGVYMRSDQKAFEHKMTSVREGNFTDMIKLAQTQQLLSEYASNNHLRSYAPFIAAQMVVASC